MEKNDMKNFEETITRFFEECEKDRKERLEKARKRFEEICEKEETEWLTEEEEEEHDRLIDEINRLEGKEKENTSAWAYDDISECGDFDAVLKAIEDYF